MARCQQLAQQIERELREGCHGRPHERFMTVRQLAARYGVSLVTAQRVLKRLKEAGLLVADSTNPAIISPAVGRRTPAGKGPRRLGMVITHVASPFFSSLCRQVQIAAAAQGYQVLMASTEYEFVRERRAVESFREIGVDGLLVVPGLEEASATMYGELAERLPLVFVSRHVERLPADFVIADNFVGGAAVAGHFVTRGYESFGYIGFATRLKRNARLSGFRSALFEQGFTLDPRHVVCGDGGTLAHGRRAMASLMERPQPPRAVFAFSDPLAIGALQYCHSRGIAVPERVAIAGFDNIPQSQVTSPPLTTVAYPVEAMARLSVQCLLQRIEGPSPCPASRVLLEPHLVVRRSSDPGAVEQAGVEIESYEPL